MLRRLLAEPGMAELDLDDPAGTTARRRRIHEKGFLCQIYQEWYAAIANSIPGGREPVLELGTGGGFLSEYIPNLVTSDVMFNRYVRAVLDGMQLPFSDDSLRGVVMTNTLHHLPRSRQFFAEATRCVRPGGVIVMVEPWPTHWSRWVYQHLHHEPFYESADWEFESSGPLSGANGMIPWMIFERDRERFQVEFPMWQIKRIAEIMSFRYLLSGGLAMRGLMPAWTFGFWRQMESVLTGRKGMWAMFANIVLVKCSIV